MVKAQIFQRDWGVCLRPPFLPPVVRPQLGVQACLRFGSHVECAPKEHSRLLSYHPSLSTIAYPVVVILIPMDLGVRIMCSMAQRHPSHKISLLDSRIYALHGLHVPPMECGYRLSGIPESQLVRLSWPPVRPVATIFRWNLRTFNSLTYT